MKTLTIKQPWASLIANGYKDIENRTWRTHFRGRIYIHASAQYACKDCADILTPTQFASINWGLLDGSFWNASAIIGEVDIVDCVINHPSDWAEQMTYHICPETGIKILCKGQKYVWNWVLANPVLYKEPILNVKGKLSFWEFNKDTPLIK